jgi:hypothetical protein
MTSYVLIALLEDQVSSTTTSVDNAIKKGVAYLKSQLPQVTDDYILAMIAYALTLAGDAEANTAFNRLLTTAIIKGT